MALTRSSARWMAMVCRTMSMQYAPSLTIRSTPWRWPAMLRRRVSTFPRSSGLPCVA